MTAYGERYGDNSERASNINGNIDVFGNSDLEYIPRILKLSAEKKTSVHIVERRRNFDHLDGDVSVGCSSVLILQGPTDTVGSPSGSGVHDKLDVDMICVTTNGNVNRKTL